MTEAERIKTLEDMLKKFYADYSSCSQEEMPACLYHWTIEFKEFCTRPEPEVKEVSVEEIQELINEQVYSDHMFNNMDDADAFIGEIKRIKIAQAIVNHLKGRE